MPHPLSAAVEMLMHTAAQSIVMPRFRNLASAEIMEKSPGDFVTIADQESEAFLTTGLLNLPIDALVIGEEAVSADPSLLRSINDGAVWVIDPIDGTTNFSEGKSPFGIMIALLQNGERIAGWMLDPVTNRMCHAVRGGGAFINDVRVQPQCFGGQIPVGAVTTNMPLEKRADFEARAIGKIEFVDVPRCAAEQYPRLVLGENQIAIFERSHPWDHAPGALFLEEAGGVIKRTDGSAYHVGDSRTGLLAAASPALWDQAAAILFR